MNISEAGIRESDVRILSPVQEAIIRTLIYFEQFRYPLTVPELSEYCQQHTASPEEIQSALSHLVMICLVQESEGFYALSLDKAMIRRRLKGNAKAKIYLQKAKRYVQLIACFPFIEAVFLSGSLAKGFVDEKGDVDYFIITKPGRLWVARTFLVLFKKIFLLNSRKYFCVNYFLDSANLEIPDKNLFTATEISFAIPVYNQQLCASFFELNAWSIPYYPNKGKPALDQAAPLNTNLIRRVTEKMLASGLGTWLDTFCFRLTLRVWKKKFSQLNESDFDLNFRSRKNVSKHHPGGFQLKVLEAQQKNFSEFIQKHQVSLHR